MLSKEREILSNNPEKIFERYPQVISAYLFGSYLRNKKRAKDVDIAIQFKGEVKNKIINNIIAEFEQLFGKNIDLVILNEASIFVKFKIFQTGKRIFERDFLMSRRFMAHELSEYYELQPTIFKTRQNTVEMFRTGRYGR